MPDYANYFVYFGSRTSQPARAWVFIDLAVERQTDNPEYVLSSKELLRGQRDVRSSAARTSSSKRGKLG